MRQHDRSEALFYYFRLEDQFPENHLLRAENCDPTHVRGTQESNRIASLQIADQHGSHLFRSAGLLSKSGVGVEKVRDRNVFPAAMIAVAEFMFSPQLPSSGP